MPHHLTCIKTCIFLVVIKTYQCTPKLFRLSGDNADDRCLSQPTQLSMEMIRLILCSVTKLCCLDGFFKTKPLPFSWDDHYLWFLLSKFIIEVNHSAARFCVLNKQKHSAIYNHLLGSRIIFYLSDSPGGHLGITDMLLDFSWGRSMPREGVDR